MKPKSTWKSKTLFLSAFAICATSQSRAALVIWDGSDSTVFSDGLNWVPSNAPADDLTTDTAQFSGVLTANQPAVTANRSVSGLQFDTDGWTLGGGSILKVGEGGILANGNTVISAPLQIRNVNALAPGLPGAISVASGKTLSITLISSDAGSNAFVQLNSGVNAGTISMNGTSDNGFLSGELLAGKIIMNKGTLGGNTNTGSSFSNLTIASGAIAEFGVNTTDRNDAGLRGRGQIFGTANVNGTLDLKGNGTFSDNWSLGNLNGAASGLVTNTGTGAAQIRIMTGGNFAGNFNDGNSSTALRVDMDTTGNSFTLNNSTGNTYSGGTEILNGELRIRNDNSLGVVPSSVSTNIVINGAGAKLMNYLGSVTVNANRTIEIGAAGGGFKAGYGAGTTLTIAGAVTGTGSVIIAPDSGTVVYGGINTYTGNTVLTKAAGGNGAKLTLADNAQMLFKLGANGVNNSISGTIPAVGTDTNTLSLEGDFVIDMALAVIADGNVWTLVDVGTLSADPFKSTFSVVGFTEAADVWTLNSGNNNWTFRESNGQLSLMVVPEPSVALLGAFGALALLRRRR